MCCQLRRAPPAHLIPRRIVHALQLQARAAAALGQAGGVQGQQVLGRDGSCREWQAGEWAGRAMRGEGKGSSSLAPLPSGSHPPAADSSPTLQ